MPISDTDIKIALLKQNILTKEALDKLIAEAAAKNVPFSSLIYEKTSINTLKLGKIFAQLYDVPFIQLAENTIPENLLRVVPYNMASHQLIMPFEQTDKILKVAMANPENYELINFVEKKTGLEVQVHYATPQDIKKSLKAYNRDVDEKFNKLLEGAMEKPHEIESLKEAAKILDTIILLAYQNSASDIHIESHREMMIVRFRIDGILHIIAELPLQILELVVTRIKVLANLRTDEHRVPQDGRFKIELDGNEITMRVSTVPTYGGEKAVLRLLSSSNQELNLEALGYETHNLNLIKDNISKTHGIILMTGPTGSGKTTTLYSILKMLNSPEVNISTIEDPIEYQLEGVNQIQVNNKAGLTFASGLRALLRQDPDIILVGEIRDEETASIAINAALTGHLVLATLHTNDAATTLPRMSEMGVELFLLAATAQVVIAQRLVRTLCKKCKTPYEVPVSKLLELQETYGIKESLQSIFENIKQQQQEEAKPKSERTPSSTEENNGNTPPSPTPLNPNAMFTLYRGDGCNICGGTGFKGRSSVSEVLDVTDKVRKAILDGASNKEIEETAESEEMIPMFVDGLTKVLRGDTTIEEILRVMKA